MPVIEMNLLELTIRISGAVLVLQLLLGGLVTFNFAPALPHIAIGFTLYALSFIVLVLAFLMKPVMKRVRGMSIGVVLLLTLQISLGFDTLHTGNQIVAYLHYVNALVIFGLILTESMVVSREMKEKSLTHAGAKVS